MFQPRSPMLVGLYHKLTLVIAFSHVHFCMLGFNLIDWRSGMYTVLAELSNHVYSWPLRQMIMFFITCQRILQEKTGSVAYVVTEVLWVVHNPLDTAIQIFFFLTWTQEMSSCLTPGSCKEEGSSRRMIYAGERLCYAYIFSYVCFRGRKLFPKGGVMSGQRS